jgi:preprotein translocase subunit SecG
MTYVEPIILTLHVLVAIAVCGFVLLQHGKGADMGAAFGSGASGSLFGAAGSANFLSRTTAILAAVFFLTSIGLTYFATTHGAPQSVMERAAPEKTAPPPAPKASEVPQPSSTGTPPAVPGTEGAKPGEVPK